jgi:ABC-type sugar transport system permease subunit
MGPNQEKISIFPALRRRMTTEVYAQAFKPHSGFGMAACAATLLAAGTFGLSTCVLTRYHGSNAPLA